MTATAFERQDAEDARAYVSGFREARRDAGIDRLPPVRYAEPRAQRRFEAGWRAGQLSWLRELRASRGSSSGGAHAPRRRPEVAPPVTAISTT